MHISQISRGSLALLAAMLILASTTSADELEITVTSHVPAGGSAFSPIWFGVHDGTFDTFDPGAAASAGVEAIAELADAAPITAAFSGNGPQTTVPSPGGPFTPGASGSGTLNVPTPAANRYLSFLAMIVPSNDMFIGNAGPMDIELFDAGGNFVGPVIINVFGSQVWDAGTEVNNVADGVAFIMGSDATNGTDEGGVISLILPDDANYLDSFLGLTTGGGYTYSEIFGAQDLIATIEINRVPEPSTALLAGIGLAALAIVCHQRGRNRARLTSGA